jgi:hypothetical protein
MMGNKEIRRRRRRMMMDMRFIITWLRLKRVSVYPEP